MARSLDQIIQELDAGYSPTRQLINEKINALPAQAEAEVNGLKATQDQAFGDILAGARSRGMGFSGIPLAEQAKYTATNFMPAVARVRQAGVDARNNLTEALLASSNEQRQKAMSLQQAELDREEQARQFDKQLAASRAGSAGPAFSFGGGDMGAPAQAPAGAQGGAQVSNTMFFRVPGDAKQGFGFKDAWGNNVNAFQYAQGNNIEFRKLLSQMAQAGDQGARTALTFVGNDGNADPTKITNKAMADLYKALTGRSVKIYNPSKTYSPPNNGLMPMLRV